MAVRRFAPALVCALAGLLAPAAAAPAPAAPRTIDLPALQALTAGLGLDDSSDRKTFVQVDHQGSRDYSIYVAPSSDGSSVLIYTYLGGIPGQASALVPTQRMLEFNDTHLPYFTIGVSGDARSLYMQYRLSAPAVTPQTLRAGIDGVLAAADESQDLWSAEAWPAATKPAAFAVGNVMFVEAKADVLGDYHRRASSVFAPTDKLITYGEIAGLDYKPVGDVFQFGFSVDLELRTKSGETVDGKKDISKQVFSSHNRLKEVMNQITLSLDGVRPGDYVVAYTYHDIASDRTATSEQPFTIKAAN